MKREHLLVGIILLIGLIARFIFLDHFPPGLHNDEASFLYNTIAITETLHDEDGQFLPLYLRSYIDPKPALISYLQAPFVAMLNNNIMASRIPTVIIGWSSLFIAYLLVKELGMKYSQRLIFFLLLSISPWHIVISRSTQEVIVSFFFGLTALLFLIKLINQRHLSIKKNWLLIVGLLILTLLASYTYHSAKILIPLLSAGLLIFSPIWKKNHKLTILLFFLIVMAVSLTFIPNSSTTRFSAVSIFSNDYVKAITIEQLNTASPHTPIIVNRIFHNKAINTGRQLFNNYLLHFSPSFLIFSLEQPMRYNIPYQGLLFLVEFPLLIFGLLYAFTQRKQRITQVMFWWLLVAPIPATLTNQEIPSSIRAFFLVVPILYFVSLALWVILQWIRQQLKSAAYSVLGSVVLLSIVLTYLWQIGFFWQQSLVAFAYYQPWYRNSSDQNMATMLDDISPKYKKVIISKEISGQPYIYLALNNLISLSELQNSYPARLGETFSIGKYEFISSSCPLQQEVDTLFVINFSCELTAGYQQIGQAPYADKNNGYIFVEFDPTLIKGLNDEK